MLLWEQDRVPGPPYTSHNTGKAKASNVLPLSYGFRARSSTALNQMNVKPL